MCSSLADHAPWRYTGMVKLQTSMNAYVKWLGQREGFGEREKGVPAAVLGRTMVQHGEDFDTDSEFGNCLIGMFAAPSSQPLCPRLQQTFVSV